MGHSYCLSCRCPCYRTRSCTDGAYRNCLGYNLLLLRIHLALALPPRCGYTCTLAMSRGCNAKSSAPKQGYQDTKARRSPRENSICCNLPEPLSFRSHWGPNYSCSRGKCLNPLAHPRPLSGAHSKWSHPNRMSILRLDSSSRLFDIG